MTEEIIVFKMDGITLLDIELQSEIADLTIQEYLVARFKDKILKMTKADKIRPKIILNTGYNSILFSRFKSLIIKRPWGHKVIRVS